MKKLFLFLLILSLNCLCLLLADLTDGLIGYYPFNGNANDESGNGNHGTPNGAYLTIDRFGDADEAYYFDGIDDNIDCGDPADDSFDLLGDFSLVGWISVASTPPGSGSNVCYSIIGKDVWNGTNVKKWIFGIKNGNTIFHFNGPGYGGGYWVYSNAFTVNLNTFYHVAVTKTGDLYTFYVNGEHFGQVTQSQPIYDVPTTLTIGYSEPSSPFHGDIDEMRIYDRPITLDEIQELYFQDGWMSHPVNMTINIADNSVEINWNAVVGATSYNVYSSEYPYGTFDLLQSGINNTNWSEIVTENMKYYQVRAVN